MSKDPLHPSFERARGCGRTRCKEIFAHSPLATSTTLPQPVVAFGRDHPELKSNSIDGYRNLSLLGLPPEYRDQS